MNINKKKASEIKAKIRDLNNGFDRFKNGVDSPETFRRFLLKEVEEVKTCKIVEYQNEINFNLKELEKLSLIKSKLLRDMPLTQHEKEVVFKYI
ncbi:hypothetical protein ABMY20_15305 [Tenacibaculum sp. SSH1-16]|uniref:hypothetical protein n=1 Tax=Tenacibaculum sp. SSH1-16 TaxID=3136667 RepID=UPI0032C48CF0|nr:hypothetical protein BACY1_20810 [Tenacibaculum mesophilum]